MNYQQTIGLTELGLMGMMWLGVLLLGRDEFQWTKRLAFRSAGIFIAALIFQYNEMPPVVFNDYCICWFNAAAVVGIVLVFVISSHHEHKDEKKVTGWAALFRHQHCPLPQRKGGYRA